MKSSKHIEEDETETSTKRTKKSSSSANTKKSKPKKTKKTKSETEGRTKETNELSLSVKNTKNIEKCLSYLESYFHNLNTSNLENIITEKNLNNFQKLNEIENIEVDLLLTKIYNKIFSSEYLYSTFFSDQEENEDKIDITLALIDEVLQNIENFDDAVISLENFQLKGNILKLIKFMKINLKESLDKDDIKQLDLYVNDLPNKFYSKNYIEIMKYKSNIYKNNYELLKNIEKIDEIFSNLESYYEQLSAIENLFTDIELDNEEDKKNYISVSKKDIKKKKKKKKSKRRDDSDEEEEEDEHEDDEDDITSAKDEKEKITEEDLINYGQFLVNICVYQKFNFQSEEPKLNTKNSQKKKQKSKQKQTKTKSKKKPSKEEEDEEGEEEEDEEGREENNEEEEEEDEESEDDPQNCLNVFLKDVAQKTTGKKKKGKGDMKLRDLLKNKICLSSMERRNLFEIIKKNAQNFNNLIKNKKSREIKEIKEKLDLYITSIQEDKNITIDPSKINHVKYYNNFSNNKTTIPNRDSKVFYIQNAENQKGLLLIEFFVTDEKKDIIFTLSRYDLDSDDFNEIYTTGKVNKKCKICVYFDEKSLYQLEFNNEYSWINSKEINYNISMFKLCDEKNMPKENKIIENNVNINNNINNEEKLDADEENNNIQKKNKDEKKKKTEKKKEKEKEKEKEINGEEEINTKEVKISPAILNNEKEIKFICNNDNINYEFNCNKIYKKIQDYQETQKNNPPPQKSSLEISLLIYQNKIRFVNIDENNKIKYSEYCDEKDNVISKKFFNKVVFNYLKENNKPANENENNNNNKVLINLYCQNKNLSQISTKIKDLISALQDYSINNADKFQNKIYIQFLEKLGFYPDKKISNFEVKYNLYDFTDQCLIYHLFLNHIQERHLDNSALVMIFDKDTIHITSMNQNVIFNKFKIWEKNLKVKYYSQIKCDEIKTIFNFIKALAESFEGFDLVLCSMNNEEKKEEMENKFKQIKQFIDEKVEEGIRLFVYDEDKFIVDMLKYIEMFSDE